MTLTDLQALLPVIILALGATALLMIGAWWPRPRPLMLAGVVLSLAAALCAGLLQPPVLEAGKMFGTGPYGRFFCILWSGVAALTLLSSLRYGEERRFSAGEYVSLVLFAAAGMALLSGATSLVGLFLGLESFTLALYILIAFEKGSVEGAEAGLKYLVLGAVATGFVALGIALVYVSCGTFHLPEAMAALSSAGELRPLGLLGWVMLLTAIGFKISLVPFHLWTPDVYQGSPAPVAGLLATGSKGAVLASLVTVLAGMGEGRGELSGLLWMLAAATMLAGTFCALAQDNLKRMLAYSSVVHMGTVLIGLTVGGRSGAAAVVFYVVAYAVASIGAFAVITSLSSGQAEPQLSAAYRGLGYRRPFQATALSVFLFSLAGVPLTAGFLGKFGIFHAAVEAGYVGLALVGVLTSVISFYYYLRVVILMFMSEETAPRLHGGSSHEQAVLGVCLLATLVLGILPGPLLDLIRAILP